MTSIETDSDFEIRVQKIDQILPQTQCTKCGYPNCRSYAEAIAKGAPHNQCPPGKESGIQKLAELLNRPVLPLNPEHGKIQPKKVAFIREDDCIGCTKCIQACPVDAILGAPKKMHTVIQAECTGCDLCVAPCPVDCIELHELPEEKQPENLPETEKETLKNHFRKRHENRLTRLARQETERLKKHASLLNTLKTLKS